MKKIALVVQRCGREVTGGAESYALDMGRVLSGTHDVTILTSTAIDYLTWRPHYPVGTEELSPSLRIRRFDPERERDDHWQALSGVIFRSASVERFSEFSDKEKGAFARRLSRLPRALQREWMRRQGPYCPGLQEYLAAYAGEYDHIVLMTCLYPTTYFSLETLGPRPNVWVVTTLHDEPPAYLPIFRDFAAYNCLYLTETEGALLRRLVGEPPVSRFLGFGVEDRAGAEPHPAESPYILYAGRLDPAKGVDKLYEQFGRYARECPGLKLLLIGDGPLKDHAHPGVQYLGFVSEDEKFRLMKGALALVHPSAYESLGIVLIEAFMQETPVLVSARSEVLSEHVRKSGGGYTYAGYGEFRSALDALRADEAARRRMGAAGRAYYLARYSMENYRRVLAELF